MIVPRVFASECWAWGRHGTGREVGTALLSSSHTRVLTLRRWEPRRQATVSVSVFSVSRAAYVPVAIQLTRVNSLACLRIPTGDETSPSGAKSPLCETSIKLVTKHNLRLLARAAAHGLRLVRT
jgi:hypothetical protein